MLNKVNENEIKTFIVKSNIVLVLFKNNLLNTDQILHTVNIIKLICPSFMDNFSFFYQESSIFQK